MYILFGGTKQADFDENEPKQAFGPTKSFYKSDFKLYFWFKK